MKISRRWLIALSLAGTFGLIVTTIALTRSRGSIKSVSATKVKLSTEPQADTTKEEELILLLSQCIDGNNVIVDKECLRQRFFPSLDINPKDEVLYGEFGLNTDGRFFSITVRKTSRSSATVGLFDLTFYLERHRINTDGTFYSVFEARSGRKFGLSPRDWVGLVSVYDLARGGYIVNDNLGKVVDIFDVPESEHWTAKHTAANLINGGKTVGSILGERLEALERAGKGGHEYTESAKECHASFSQMGSSHQLKIEF